MTRKVPRRGSASRLRGLSPVASASSESENASSPGHDLAREPCAIVLGALAVLAPPLSFAPMVLGIGLATFYTEGALQVVVNRRAIQTARADGPRDGEVA